MSVSDWIGSDVGFFPHENGQPASLAGYALSARRRAEQAVCAIAWRRPSKVSVPQNFGDLFFTDGPTVSVGHVPKHVGVNGGGALPRVTLPRRRLSLV